jgi:hypothetical protein
MAFFVVFVFGAVILGAGAMLSPAWPTAQPRIALAATLSLALVTGGTVFYSSLFGWETLVIDYLMFALLTGIFLGGAMSFGQTRAEEAGEELIDSEQGWPGPQDLGVFAVMALAFILPVAVLPVPFGSAAQDYGLMAIAMKQGETLNTLAPFQPEISYLYSPGFNALTAYLSQQLNQSVHLVQFGTAAVLAFLNVWLIYDFGAELRDKALGRSMALVLFLSGGVFLALVNGHYTVLMGLAFIQAFFLYVLRYIRQGYPADLVGAGLMMGAALIGHAGSFFILLMGYIPWLATMWLASSPPTGRRWLGLAFGVPLIAVIATAPWLVDNWSLITAGLESPFGRSGDHLFTMVQNNGVWLAPLALLGVWLGWSRRDSIAILAIGWIFLVFDFAVTGGLASLAPFITRYLDPGDLAWQGVIIPLSWLGGIAGLWLLETQLRPRLNFTMTYRQTYWINGGVAILIILTIAFNGMVRSVVFNIATLPDTYATAGDVAALRWIQENTESDARLLNLAEPEEGDWAVIIAERDTVYLPALPYAQNSTPTQAQIDLQAFWDDPANPANRSLLLEHGITLVFVPEAIANSPETDWRTVDLSEWELGLRSAVDEAPYLTLIHDEGAQVYQLVDE